MLEEQEAKALQDAAQGAGTKDGLYQNARASICLWICH